MAEKAVVVRIYGVAFETSPSNHYVLTVDVAVTNGANAGHINMVVEAEASTFNPILPNWKSRIQDAIIEKAEDEHSLTVDEVLFADLSIL